MREYYKALSNCLTGTKNVGDNVTLTIDITQGVAPYTITYKKNGVTLPSGIQSQPSIGIYSYSYTTLSSDVGTPTFSAEVVDSCPTTPQTFTDQCIITIVEPPKALVKIEPPTQSITNGTSFTLDVTVDPQGIAISGYQFNLAFDPALISLVSVTQGNLLNRAGPTFFMQGTINNTNGTLTNNACMFLGAYNVTTKGTAATLTFNTNATGTSNITLSNVIISDPASQAVLNLITNGNVIVTQSQCSPPTCNFTMFP